MEHISKEIYISEDCHDDFIQDMAFESNYKRKKKKYDNEQYSFMSNY